jgi:hypothetical protein
MLLIGWILSVVWGREKGTGSGSGTGWAYTWQIMDSEVSMLRSVLVLCLRKYLGVWRLGYWEIHILHI